MGYKKNFCSSASLKTLGNKIVPLTRMCVLAKEILKSGHQGSRDFIPKAWRALYQNKVKLLVRLQRLFNFFVVTPCLTSYRRAMMFSSS